MVGIRLRGGVVNAYVFSIYGYEWHHHRGSFPSVRDVVIVHKDKTNAEKVLVEKYKDNYIGYIFEREIDCRNGAIVAVLPSRKLSLTGPLLNYFKFHGIRFGTKEF